MMRRTKVTTILLFSVLFAAAMGAASAGTAWAETLWYVDDNALNDLGPGDPNVSDPDEDGSADHPYDAIQEALDAASDGDTIIVRDGTYIGTGNRDIDFAGKAAHLRSENGPEKCIIDCQGTAVAPHRGFYFDSGEDENSIVDGFTIKNGYAPASMPGGVTRGGGICTFGASPTIRNCIITTCTADNGGGIHVSGGAPLVANNQIKQNTAKASGGGICSTGNAQLVIRDNTISQNRAQFGGEYPWPDPNGQGGGGIACFDSTVTIENNTVQSNTIPGAYANGAGILVSACTATVTGNTITQNTATGNGGNGGGLLCCAESTIIIDGNTITVNTANASAGIGCYKSPATIINNTISGNTGSGLQVIGPPVPTGQRIDVTITGNKVKSNVGFAVFCKWACDVTMAGNEITGNSCPGDQGGGVNWQSGVSGTISDNIISSNYSGYFGGGMMISTLEEVVITGNTISDNVAKSVAGGIQLWSTGGTVTNNVITRNKANGVSSMELWQGGGGMFANVPLVPLLISGNTFTDNVAAGDGGAIHLVQAASFSTMITFSDNTITGNSAARGGAVSWYEGNALKARFVDNTISGNTAATAGGAFFCTRQCSGSITGGRIENNKVTAGSGGAFHCQEGSGVTLTGAIIAHNTASTNGGALAVTASEPSITSCTITANSAASGGAVYMERGLAKVALLPKIKDTILWGNTAPQGAQITCVAVPGLNVCYSDIQGGPTAVSSTAGITWGTGNIDADPLFADAAGRDYHLKSEYGRWDPTANEGAGAWVFDDVTSPCIDAGDPASDYSNEPMPNFGRINMGAYGNTGEASRSAPWWNIPGDVNGDCTVNILDMIFIRNKLNEDTSTGDNWKADVTRDGAINILDLILVRNNLDARCE